MAGRMLDMFLNAQIFFQQRQVFLMQTLGFFFQRK